MNLVISICICICICISSLLFNQSHTQLYDISPGQPPITVDSKPDANDSALMNLVNTYRQGKGLPAIPISQDAWRVAATHNWDLTTNKTGWSGMGQSGCSAHSWSNQPGKWTGCCYNLSSPNGPCMWGKPREITGIKSRGYEIGSGGMKNATPQQALNMWLNSAPHKAVIDNSGMWANMKWTGFGCSLQYGQQGCWFLD